MIFFPFDSDRMIIYVISELSSAHYINELRSSVTEKLKALKLTEH